MSASSHGAGRSFPPPSKNKQKPKGEAGKKVPRASLGEIARPYGKELNTTLGPGHTQQFLGESGPGNHYTHILEVVGTR